MLYRSGVCVCHVLTQSLTTSALGLCRDSFQVFGEARLSHNITAQREAWANNTCAHKHTDILTPQPERKTHPHAVLTPFCHPHAHKRMECVPTKTTPVPRLPCSRGWMEEAVTELGNAASPCFKSTGVALCKMLSLRKTALLAPRAGLDIDGPLHASDWTHTHTGTLALCACHTHLTLRLSPLCSLAACCATTKGMCRAGHSLTQLGVVA